MGFHSQIMASVVNWNYHVRKNMGSLYFHNFRTNVHEDGSRIQYTGEWSFVRLTIYLQLLQLRCFLLRSRCSCHETDFVTDKCPQGVHRPFTSSTWNNVSADWLSGMRHRARFGGMVHSRHSNHRCVCRGDGKHRRHRAEFCWSDISVCTNNSHVRQFPISSGSWSTHAEESSTRRLEASIWSYCLRSVCHIRRLSGLRHGRHSTLELSRSKVSAVGSRRFSTPERVFTEEREDREVPVGRVGRSVTRSLLASNEEKRVYSVLLSQTIINTSSLISKRGKQPTIYIIYIHTHARETCIFFVISLYVCA